MDLTRLIQALRIQGATMTIAKSDFPDLAEMIDDCYGGQAIVLDGVQVGGFDGANDTFVRTGRSSLFDSRGLPVVATFHLVAGVLRTTLRYTLPVDGLEGQAPDWKFSHSFPDLPEVVDWRKTASARRSVLLDDLQFDNACFIVTNVRHLDAASRVPFRPGINFLGSLGLSGQVPSNGATGAIRTTFGYDRDRLLLFGTVLVPRAPIAAPLESVDALWADLDERPAPPGICLRAQLQRSLDLGNHSSSRLAFGDVCFRIYSPTSRVWLKANATYRPVLAYTGNLALPSANLPAGLAITAVQDLGANELLLVGRFEGASIGNLTGLVDLFGDNDVPAAMGVFKQAVGRLELMSATLAIRMKEQGGIEVTDASVMLGGTCAGMAGGQIDGGLSRSRVPVVQEAQGAIAAQHLLDRLLAGAVATSGRSAQWREPSVCTRPRPRPDLRDDFQLNHRTIGADQVSETEFTNLVLAEDAITGLRQALAGPFASDEDWTRHSASHRCCEHSVNARVRRSCCGGAAGYSGLGAVRQPGNH